MRSRLASTIWCWIWLLPAFVSAGSPAPVVNAPSDQDCVAITDWLAIGPFEKREPILEVDYLARSGLPESSFSNVAQRDAWLERNAREENAGERVPVRTMTTKGYLDIMERIDMVFDQAEPAKVMYLLTEISAAAEGEIFLVLGNDDRSSVFFNGKKIVETPLSQEIYTDSEPIPLKLSAGRNTLLVKAPNDNTDWVVHGTLYHDRATAELATLRKTGLVVATATSDNRRFTLIPAAALSSGNWTVQVLSAQDGGVIPHVRRGNTIECSVGMPDGLASLSISNGTATFTEDIIVGDPQKALAELRSSKLTEKDPSKNAGHVEALRQRAEILFREDNYKPNDRWWGRKIVHLLKEYEQLKGGLAPRGIQIRGFWSKIDGVHQSYRLYVPSSARAAAPAPLVIILPTSASANRPFIESAFMASHREALQLGRIAETSQVAILWPGYRNAPNSFPSDFAHFEEVLADVRRDLVVDDRRVSLIGVCGAASTAASFALKWPDAFAAVGFITPIFEREAGTKEDPRELVERSEYRDYVRHADPQLPFANEYSRSLLIVHDGAEREHGDLELSEKFVELRKKAGKPITLRTEAKTLGYRMQAFAELITWLKTQKIAGRAPSFHAANAKGHTVSEVVAEPFLLVVPSGGSEQTRKDALDLANLFQDEWRRVHFGPCRQVLDVELRPEDRRAFNLVLLGNEHCNSVWRGLGEKASVHTSADGIVINDKKVPGERLSFIARGADPANPERKMAFIGAQKIDDAGFLTLSLSICGWFSSLVTQTANDSVGLVNLTP